MQKITFNSLASVTVSEAFEEFKRKCTVNNLSERTIKLYENQFTAFKHYIDDDYMLISEVTSNHVDGFILEMRSNRQCNDITINSYLRGIRAFLYYCMGAGYLHKFKVSIPKADKKLKETYTDDELSKLLKKRQNIISSIKTFIIQWTGDCT